MVIDHDRTIRPRLIAVQIRARETNSQNRSPPPPARGWQRGYFRVELIKLKTTTNNWIVRRTERLRSIGSKHLFEIQVSNRVDPSISKSRRGWKRCSEEVKLPPWFREIWEIIIVDYVLSSWERRGATLRPLQSRDK